MIRFVREERDDTVTSSVGETKVSSGDTAKRTSVPVKRHFRLILHSRGIKDDARRRVVLAFSCAFFRWFRIVRTAEIEGACDVDVERRQDVDVGRP